MTATIRSIAKEAGVSRGTVDKVLNERPGVSPEVREKVKRIADELGYKPNLAGKALALQKKPLKIGVIMLSIDDLFFVEVYQGVKQASYEFRGYGVKLEICLMKSMDAQEQLRHIRELRDRGISALAISPVDEDIIRNELNRLAGENIKIIIFNTDITSVDKLCYVGQDLKRSGRVAGDLVGNLLPDGGNVLVINGPQKLKGLQDRVSGFQEIIREEYPEINIVGIIQDITSNEDSYFHTMKALKGEKPINAIYITARGIGGVGRALKELNRRDIKFVCFDKIPETIELIKEKIVSFTITQQPFLQGYLPIKIFFEYFFYDKLPEKDYMYTKLEIRTKENIDI